MHAHATPRIAPRAAKPQNAAVPMPQRKARLGSQHDPLEVLEEADQALFRCKEAGRNAVWIWDPARNGPVPTRLPDPDPEALAEAAAGAGPDGGDRQRD